MQKQIALWALRNHGGWMTAQEIGEEVKLQDPFVRGSEVEVGQRAGRNLWREGLVERSIEKGGRGGRFGLYYFRAITAPHTASHSAKSDNG